MRILKPKEFLELPGPVLAMRLDANGKGDEGLFIASDMDPHDCTYYTRSVAERFPLQTAACEKRLKDIDPEEHLEVDFSTPTREVVYLTAMEAIESPVFFAMYTGNEVRELIDTLLLALPSNQRRKLADHILTTLN